MKLEDINTLPEGKKIYFASDFHLGVPNQKSSLEREKKIIRWLDSIKNDAHAIILLGDLFDFWYEYKRVVPKGFVRILGKLAELKGSGLPIFSFTGNHDMWMFDYFPNELDIPVYREPVELNISGKKLMFGHGDGLGPGDRGYKFIKMVFANKLCQWAFGAIHPDLGIRIANYWSKTSRNSVEESEFSFDPDTDFIYNFCLQTEKTNHHDYYIFGHRHLVIDVDVNEKSKYLNPGEWITGAKFVEFDGDTASLKTFEN